MTGAGPMSVDEARAEVARLLEILGVPAEADGTGGWTIPHGPVTVAVAVSDLDGRTVIDVWAAVVERTPRTAELLRFAAETSFLFGRLCVAPVGDGLGQLQLCHTMVAEPLDHEILVQCLGPVANTAAELAGDLASRFPTA